jgi:hypothetical protein
VAREPTAAEVCEGPPPRPAAVRVHSTTSAVVRHRVGFGSMAARDYRRGSRWTPVPATGQSLAVTEPPLADDGVETPAERAPDPEPPPSDTEPTAGSPADDDQPVGRAPRWFECSVLGLVGLLAGTGVVGLGLALIGEYRTWIAVLGGAVVGVGATLVIGRSVGGRPAGRHATIGALLALIMAGTAVTVAMTSPSQNVVVTRDPGSYVNTALWLSRTGTLEVERDQGTFAEIPDLRYAGAAVYETADGDLQFQFNHLASVVMAAAYDVGGHRLLYRSPALAVGLGLLALYAVTVRVTRRPYVSLLAPALLTLSMPMLYVARNTYSEPFTLAILWGALLVLGTLHARPRVAVGALGGLLMGALVSVRVDALLYVSLLAPLAAISIAVAPDRARRRARLSAWASTLVVGVLVGLLGWIDLVDRSGRYVDDLAPQVAQLRLLVIASYGVSAVGLVAWWNLAWLRAAWSRLARPVSTIAAVAVVAALLAGWFVRPLVQEVTTGTPFSAVESLQLRAGLPVEPARTYYEYSLWWMSWYLGIPALAAAIVGMGLLARRFLRGAAGPWGAGVLALGAASGALYWWNPSITPDHLWAMRRFVPAVLPSLAVLVAVTLGSLLALLARHTVARAVTSVIAVVVVLVPPALTTWPVHRQSDQRGYLYPVLDACGMAGDDAAMIVVGGAASLTLPQTLRSWCGVPVAAQGDAFGRELAPVTAASIATSVAAEGRELYLVAQNPSDLGGFLVEGGPTPQGTRGADDRWAHVARLDGPPEEYREDDHDQAVPSPFQLFLLRVEPEQPGAGAGAPESSAGDPGGQ